VDWEDNESYNNYQWSVEEYAKQYKNKIHSLWWWWWWWWINKKKGNCPSSDFSLCLFLLFFAFPINNKNTYREDDYP
jgi:hypothetical protein